MKRFITTLLGAAVALGLFAGSASAEQIKLKMATSWGGGLVMDKQAKYFAEMVEFLTNNEIQIEVFPGGTLGTWNTVTETVRNGVADMGHTYDGYNWGENKAVALLSGYAGGLNAEQLIHWLYHGGGQEMIQEFQLEEFGVIALPCGISPREMGLHSTKRVQTLEDFKGLKVRTSGIWAEISKDMGVSAVILPGSEIYAALERGVVDAVEWAQLSVNKAAGFHKVAKYLIMPGIHQPAAVGTCNFNVDVWNKLSDRQKKIIEIAARKMSIDFYHFVGHEDAPAYEFYLSSGNEIVVLDDEVIKRARELSYAWADRVAAEEGGWFQKILDSQRAYEKAWANAYKYRDSVKPAAVPD
jgi:TRAP-type mannitol/chloroaromatic compound transport system substrate-binding protein